MKTFQIRLYALASVCSGTLDIEATTEEQAIALAKKENITWAFEELSDLIPIESQVLGSDA